MTNKDSYDKYVNHMFEAAALASKHFLELEGANLNDYAKQKGDLLESLIKLYVDVDMKEAICPLEDIKFKAYKVNMKMDSWD